MLFKDFFDKIESIFKVTPEIEVQEEDKKFNLRSYKNKQYLLAESNKRIPLVDENLDKFKTNIDKNIDLGCKIRKITVRAEDFGYNYTKEISAESFEEFEEKLKREEIVNKIIIKGDNQ